MGIIGIFLVCWKEGWNKCCDWFCKTLPQPVVNMVRDSNKTAFLKLKICANTTLTYSITHTASPSPPMQSCFENDLQHSRNIDKGEAVWLHQAVPQGHTLTRDTLYCAFGSILVSRVLVVLCTNDKIKLTIK